MFIIRVVTAIAGLLYLSLMFYIGGWFFDFSVLIITLVATRELYGAFLKKGFKPMVWLGFLLVLISFYLMLFESAGYTWIYILLVVLFSLAIPILIPSVRFLDSLLTIFGGIYPGLALLSMIPLAHHAQPYTTHLLVVTFYASWATDAFAYITGTLFGKTKLSPQISPNKTVEGSLGGVAGSIIVGLSIAYVINIVSPIDLVFYHYAIISLLCGIVSQIGDLAASSIKRFCRVKDFGNILPGHGGILDRFDSVIFTVPMVYAYYLIFLAP